MSYWVRIDGLLLNRSRLWLPWVSFPYMPMVSVVMLPAETTASIADVMSKSPGTVPPEHIVPFTFPTDLSDLEVIGLVTPLLAPGWELQSKLDGSGLTHLIVMVSEPWPHESHAERTSSIFSVVFRTWKLVCRPLTLNAKKLR